MPVVWITARRLPTSAGRAVTGTTVISSDDSAEGAARLQPDAEARSAMTMRKEKVRVK
jgi:hypothetical protein